MDVPTLPTDNLYKFVALAGLVIAGYSGTFPLIQLADLERQRIRLDVEGKILDLEMESQKRGEEQVDKSDRRKALTELETLLARNLELRKKMAEHEGKIREGQLVLSKVTEFSLVI